MQEFKFVRMLDNVCDLLFVSLLILAREALRVLSDLNTALVTSHYKGLGISHAILCT